MKNPTQETSMKSISAAFFITFLLEAQPQVLPQSMETLTKLALEAELKRSAQSGGSMAQVELGRRHEFGIATEANSRLAAHWYRLAANQGLAKAEYSLGRLYSTGDGVPQDQARAVKYFRRAAAKGYGLAQHRLARAYELGQGLPRDLVEAHRWYTLAANENGFASSRLNLKKLEARMNEAQLAQVRVPSPKFLAIVNASKGE